LYCNK
jgi:hypothetical protein